MFDIGFQELLLISVIGLLIMGPERLPGAIRTTSLWLGRLRQGFQQIKHDIEQEVGVDDIKQQLHNESVLKALDEQKNSILGSADDIKSDIDKLQHDISDAVNSDAVHPEPDTPRKSS